MIGRLLIANRGEIACRVIRTARRLGIRTIAVHSDADRSALHVRLADEAVRIGEAPATASYLDVDALLDAARRTGADAVHPGYGFLSERPAFADACTAAGLVFVGPPAAAMHAMGDKAEAKRRMIEAGVPCAPGYFGSDQSDQRLLAEAVRIGLPLLVKAVAGGGGRGMRLVFDHDALPGALAGARREADSAFGDGRLMLEQLIADARHVEIQVFCDRHGNAVHLGERDCTAQRRRQKVIEEAPSPIVDAALRQAMGDAAVAAARAVGYVGAGTVEFVVDAGHRFHFLEMNTRLQVEHPVTECLTGIDLVEWQLRIAEGEPLPLTQDAIRFEGHAIEARLLAEDPYDGWRPQTGRITGWSPAADGAVDASDGALGGGVRIDHGIAAGDEVGPWYDPMVAKFVAHGRTRADAIRRLTHLIERTPLFGVVSNGRFLRDLLRHPRFASGTMITTLLDDWAAAGDEPLLQRPAPPDAAWQLAAALRAGGAGTRPASVARFDITLQSQGQTRRIAAPPDGLAIESCRDGEVRWRHDGVLRRTRIVDDGTVLALAFDGAVHTFTEASAAPQAAGGADPSAAVAPVAGLVAALAVAEGQAVEAGQPLVCIEAMKMEIWVHAAAAGTVRAVHARAREVVAAGVLLVELEIPDVHR